MHHVLPSAVALRPVAKGMALAGLAFTLALSLAPTARAAGPSLIGDGLHISTGALVDPVGRTWISDHNGGFCRMTEPSDDRARHHRSSAAGRRPRPAHVPRRPSAARGHRRGRRRRTRLHRPDAAVRGQRRRGRARARRRVAQRQRLAAPLESRHPQVRGRRGDPHDGRHDRGPPAPGGAEPRLGRQRLRRLPALGHRPAHRGSGRRLPEHRARGLDVRRPRRLGARRRARPARSARPADDHRRRGHRPDPDHRRAVAEPRRPAQRGARARTSSPRAPASARSPTRRATASRAPDRCTWARRTRSRPTTPWTASCATTRPAPASPSTPTG